MHRRADDFAVAVQPRDAERRVLVISRTVRILLAADGREHEHVVELVDTAAVIACDTRIAAEFEAAVVLDAILHEEAVVVVVIAARWVDGCRDVEVAAVDEQTIAMNLSLRRIARMTRPLVEVLIRFRELVACMCLDVVHEVHFSLRTLQEHCAVLTSDADLSEVVAGHVDETVICHSSVRIRYGGDDALCGLCGCAEFVRVEQEGRQKVRRAVRIAARKEHALALLMIVERSEIAAEPLHDGLVRFRVNVRRHTRTADRAKLAVRVVRWIPLTTRAASCIFFRLLKYFFIINPPFLCL